jgi:hypothetical protein
MKPPKLKQFSRLESDNFILTSTKIPSESCNIVTKRGKIILDINVNSMNYKKTLMFNALRSEFQISSDARILQAYILKSELAFIPM